MTAVTMPTSPKSLGSSSRPKIIKEPRRTRKFAAWEQSLAKPPRIVFSLRSLIGNSRSPITLLLQHHFPTVKRLGIAAWGVAFHPPQTHQGKKSVLLEPVFAVLGLKGVHDVGDLPLVYFRFERYELARLSHVAVVLWNFILENQMVAKCIPGHICDQAMVLVSVLAVVSKDEVGGNVLFQFFKSRLYFGSQGRHKPIRESPERKSSQTGWGDE